MQSLWFVEPGQLEWRDVPAPRLGGPLEALVTPVAASACDLDRLLIDGKPPYSPRSPYAQSFAIGHEAVARVVEIGDAVRSVVPGDLVVVPWHLNCGDCGYCQRGLPAYCEKVARGTAYGLPTGENWGGLFDDLVRVPFADAMLHKLPAGIDPAEAVSAGDNLSLGRALVAPHLAAGRSRVLVLGSGANGLYIAAFAGLLGASRVVYVDDAEANRAIAEQFGATAFPGPPDRAHGRFDLVVDAALTPAWLRRVVHMLEPEGMIECMAHFTDISLPGEAVYGKGVTFHCALCSNGPHIPETLRAIEQRRLLPSSVWSNRVPWEALPHALAEGGRKVVGVRVDR
jgi:threonine dehydrogenase-like Zn-dependent dehydrogenase